MMLGVRGKALGLLIVVVVLAGCAGLLRSGAPPPRFTQTATLGEPAEWRFNALVVDVNRDGRPDLVATARLVKDYLSIFVNDGNGGYGRLKSTWTDIGYSAIATGDINGDGFPDFVGASHFARMQILLSDGSGGFTEKVVKRDDGHVATQLVDLDRDGHLDLLLLGFQKSGLEIHGGDGTGNFTLQSTLPDPRPGSGRSMAGRSLAVGDLNHDGHLDLVAAFYRWGIYVYYGDGRFGFTGGHVDLGAPSREFQSVALADVNRDGHLDVLINGTIHRDKPNGPDVYLGDGKGGWTASSNGLKVLANASTGLGIGDLDGDGHLDLVAAGNTEGDVRSGYGLFWFRGDGKGGWRLVKDSGLPTKGLSIPHNVTVADIDGDGVPELVVLTGSESGRFTIWKQQRPLKASQPPRVS
jgi:hypothetical protein